MSISRITVKSRSGRIEEHINPVRLSGAEVNDGLGINGFTVVTKDYYRAHFWNDVESVNIERAENHSQCK